MCLAQGPQRSNAGEARTRALRSRVKNSTTELMSSVDFFQKNSFRSTILLIAFTIVSYIYVCVCKTPVNMYFICKIMRLSN